MSTQRTKPHSDGWVSISSKEVFYDDNEVPVGSRTITIVLTAEENARPTPDRAALIDCLFRSLKAKKHGPSWASEMEEQGRINNPLRDLTA